MTAKTNKTPSLAKASATMGRVLMSKPNAKRSAKKPAAKKAPAPKKLSAVEADRIVTVVGDHSGSFIVVSSAGGRNVNYERNRETKELRSLAKVGGSFKAVEAAIKVLPVKPAKLARGLDSRIAPQSAKAAADSNKSAAKPSKAEKKAAPKAAKNKQPSKGADRSYSLGSKKNEAKEGTWRHHMLTMIQKHGTTDKAKAAHAKSGQYSANKLDFNWANSQGYIKFDK